MCAQFKYWLLMIPCPAVPLLCLTEIIHYLLRTAPYFLSNVFTKYDDTLRETLSIVANTRLAAEDPTWIQATLPVILGGLGIHSAAQIAPTAYLASVAASAELVVAISTDSLCSLPAPSTDLAQPSCMRSTALNLHRGKQPLVTNSGIACLQLP